MPVGWLTPWRSFMVEQRALLDELPTIAGRLGDIATPTVVIVGEADRIVRPSSQDSLFAGVPDAERVRVPRAGHLLLGEAPRVVAEAVLRRVGVAPPEGGIAGAMTGP
jgi:pimeloyl-ACP methyl ester carboxylesterase